MPSDPQSPAVWGYGGGPEQTAIPPLKQIDRSNVKQLALAWTYDTGETGAMQTQPLVVGDVLFGVHAGAEGVRGENVDDRRPSLDLRLRSSKAPGRTAG